jgi:uncharacterized damage-inducible protein DinB
MRTKVIEHLNAAELAHHQLIDLLSEDDLGRRMGDRSNTVGAQMWCVVGARESYAKAIENDGWIGFGCSLSGEDTTSKDLVLEALARSRALLAEAMDGVDWTDTREGLLLDLLEHEVQHQGQIIRYVYSLGRRFPESWATRWALDQPD